MQKKYKNQIEEFTAYIINNDVAAAEKLVSEPAHASKQTALKTYTEGYLIRLIKVVESTYPAFGNYIGAEKFRVLISLYIQSNPSRSYNLDFYPLEFPEFLKKQKDIPFEAIELCQLECEIQKVFFMTESEPLTMHDIAAISMAKLGELVLKLRSASLFLSLRSDVEHYLSNFRAGEVYEVNISTEVQNIIIYRHNNLVKRYRLNEVELKLIKAAKSYETLDSVFSKLEGDNYSETEILEAFKGLLELGIFRN